MFLEFYVRASDFKERQDRQPVTLDPPPIDERSALDDRLMLFAVLALEVVGPSISRPKTDPGAT
jgi:hypothetical protein